MNHFMLLYKDIILNACLNTPIFCNKICFFLILEDIATCNTIPPNKSLFIYTPKDDMLFYHGSLNSSLNQLVTV